MDNRELGKDFARYCLEEEWPSLDYPFEEDGVVYTNSLEYASGFAKNVCGNMDKMTAEAQEFAQGFLLKFD